MNGTSQCSDDNFGPAFSCPNSFDFTLVFEQGVLSISASAIFLVLLPFELLKSWRSTKKTLPSRTFIGKALLSAKLLALHLALVILWSRNDTLRTAIPYSVLSLVAIAALSILTLLDHHRAVKSSSLLIAFLLISVLFDAAQARSLFLRGTSTEIAAILSTVIALKVFLLTVELRNKRTFLKEPYKNLPPEALSNILNRIFFWWINPTFRQGYGTGLTLESLCEVDITLQTGSVQQRILDQWKRCSQKGRYALVHAFAIALRWPMLAVVVPRLALVGFNYAQPFLINRAIRLLEEKWNDETRNYGYGLIAATGIIYLGIAMSTALYQYKLRRFLTLVRTAGISLIYVTSLHASAEDQDEATTATLMSTDVDRVVTGLELVHETWARLLEVAIGVWLLAMQMGAIAVAPVLVVILCFAWQTWLARYIGPRQLPWIQAIQTRVGKTSSVLRNMKAVRVMGLADVVETTLQGQRIRELQLSKAFRWMIVWINMVASIPQTLAPLVVFASYSIRSVVTGGDQLSAVNAFTSLAIISLVTSPTVNLLASIPSLRVAEGCLDRIQKYLRASSGGHERSTHRRQPSSHSLVEDPTQHEMPTIDAEAKSDGYMVKLKDVTLGPNTDTEALLDNVNLNFQKASFTIVTGPVGSGKSLFLKTLLGETIPRKGSVSVFTKSVAYCSQTPWLPNGSFRDVLCGAEEFAAEWYNSVIHSCDLKQDIDEFPQGDLSIIGSRGSNLSGGQRQRLALARAIYARRELLLLDDVFSGLDKETEYRISQRLFAQDGLLRKSNCTTIFVTHSGMFPTRIRGLDAEIEVVRSLSMADAVIVLDPEAKTARSCIPNELETLPTSASHSSTTSQHSSIEEKKASPVAGMQNTRSATATNAVKGCSIEDLEDLARRTGDTSCYLYYYKAIGLTRTVVAVVILVIYTFASNFPRYWIKWYTDNPTPRFPVFIGVYVWLVAMASLSQGAMIWQIMINIVPKSGAELHRILLRTIMHAPMRFFWTTDSGVTLNRFSQDMTLVDAVLPTAAFGTFLAVFQCAAQLAFIAIGSSYMAVCIPVAAISLFFIQKVYLRTSRQLRFLDLEARSPLFTHFVETTEGLASIRAFNWHESFIERNIRCLNQSQKPYYLLLCIQQWLILVLDLMVAAIALILMALAMTLRSSTNGGALGVGLTAVLSFNQALQTLMISWTQMETSLGAIARTKNLETALPPEDTNDEDIEPPADWPRDGSIEFRDVSLSYNEETIALDHVSFRIEPRQKVAILGRTGSGKSTILAALLRLVDISPTATPGQILIDNTPITSINRKVLRSRILSIPQDPVYLPGSVRYNAYPFSEDEVQSHDELIVAALEKVALWEVIKEHGGLDGDMAALSLSQGQGQLFAIARAIIRKDIGEKNDVRNVKNDPEPAGDHFRHRILLIDEATSNVDADTDTKMQALIGQEFRHFTVITIAHRLVSIRGADVVGVMDQGEMVKFGPAAEILGDITEQA